MSSSSVAYLHWYYNNHNNSAQAAEGSEAPTTTCFCDPVSATGKNNKNKNRNSTTATTACTTEFPVHYDKVKVRPTPQTLAALFGVHMVVVTISEDNDSSDAAAEDDYEINEWLEIRELLLDLDGNGDGDGSEEHQVLLPLLNDGGVEEPDLCYYWDLQPGKHYNVTVNPKYLSFYKIPTPIHQIFRLLPGRNSELKSDNLEKLSNTFYDLIWHSPMTPPEFSKLFVTKWATSGIQAFRQYDWFHELFGGPSMQSEDDNENEKGSGKGKAVTGCPHAAAAGANAGGGGGGGGCPAHHFLVKEEEDKRDLERLVHLRKKMMIKHASSRMTCEYAITWLRLMNQAVDQVFPTIDENVEEENDCSTIDQREQLRYSLNCYWLHFFALFPYTEKERQQFRDVVFSSTKSTNGKVEEQQQEESSFFDPELVKQVEQEKHEGRALTASIKKTQKV